MNRNQTLTIIGFMLIFVIIYFGCDTKNQEQRDLEKSRSENIELLNIDRVKAESKEILPSSVKLQVNNLEEQLRLSSLDEDKLTYLKSLASLWYSEGHALISAYYAEKIAEIEVSEQSWAIAGTSYSIAAKRAKEENERKYSFVKSRSALENALSINPTNIDCKINLTLSYVDMPLEGNPMKGILMLLDLNKEHPDNSAVLVQLGRLALSTNQLDKAIERLSSALKINPELQQAHCLLYEVYSKNGDARKAEEEKILCETN